MIALKDCSKYNNRIQQLGNEILKQCFDSNMRKILENPNNLKNIEVYIILQPQLFFYNTSAKMFFWLVKVFRIAAYGINV